MRSPAGVAGRLIGATAVLATVVALPAVAAALETSLVSKSSAGNPVNADAYQPSISGSGRFVSFFSAATNLPGNDGVADVYVRDRDRGKTHLVSRKSSGRPAAGGGSFNSAISRSGRFVAFDSEATNLPGDDAVQDVYVHDRRTGKTRLVSRTSGGAPANGHSFGPAISGSGRYVAFESEAGNLPGDDGFQNVYVHDRRTGKTRLVSRTSGGEPANGPSFAPSLSRSGRVIAFEAVADNLPGEDSVDDEVYVHDRKTGKTRLVSKTSGGEPSTGSESPSISASGRYVAFESHADNLPGNDLYQDVFVHDRRSGKTRLVSRTSGEDDADGDSGRGSLSGSGQRVAFYSSAPNLPGDDAVDDVYVRDLERGKTKLVSQTSGGASANGQSFNPAISAGGLFVAFQSDATNLPGDDSARDVYVRGPRR